MSKATTAIVSLLRIAFVCAFAQRVSAPLAVTAAISALFLLIGRILFSTTPRTGLGLGRWRRRLLLGAPALLGLALGLSSPATAQSCTNLACFQVTCLGDATTSISGTVYAPNGADPIPHVLVFVPNGTVEAFVDGPADDTEASLVTGSPLVTTTTAANGLFTLTNVPAGTNFPLVLQAGRWRRQLTVPAVTSCVNTPVSNFNPPEDVFARFPKTQVEGDIPKMALATGSVDALECSLRKIGVADTEFTDYTVDATGLSSPGRISLFEGSGSSGAKAGSTTHTEDQLVGSTSSTIGGSLLGNYNVLLLPCQGTNGYIDSDGRGNAITFAGEGGRIFATHHSVLYLNQDASIDGAADWRGATSDSIGAGEATINTSFSSGMTLAQWLQDIGATSTLGQVAMSSLFSDQTGINAPTQSWATFNTAEFGVASPILQLSFYTPVGASTADQFGRVMYNEYHVDSTSTSSAVTFPAECSGSLAKTAAFTPQEHMLEYSLFDLMNFAVPVIAPTVSIDVTNSPSTFTGGDVGDTVIVTVENTGGLAIPTTPVVLLTVSLPSGLTPIAMTDSAGIYSCNFSTLTCTLTTAWSASVTDTITISVGVAANVSAGSPSVSATVGSAGFSSNVTSPITLTVDAAPADTVTAGPSASAGTVNLQSTGSATATFAISGGTTIGTISVVTQGATGLDFTNAGSGTCATMNYDSSASCTVNVTFSPTHPGPRDGAIKLLDGSGNLLATQYVTAIGVSPQVIFSPGVQSALGGGFSQPYGVATDSSGNLYVADPANNAVKKIPSGCASSSCVITIGGGFSAPYGVAVDGAGNVLVADNGNNTVKQIPSGCTSSTCVITVNPVGGPAGIAVDGDGNIYVTDAGDGIVIEIPQGCLAEGCTITLGGGWNNPSGLATDGNGNLFVADEGNAAVKELAVTCLTSGCVSEIGGGISRPDSVVVDASGNVFVGDQGSTAVRKIPSGCTSSSCVSTLSGTFAQPYGLALDGSGNLFVGNASATTVAKLDFADPPSLSFASLHVGSTGTAQAVTVSNDGNATLDFTASGLTAPADFLMVAGSGTPPDCADSGTVGAGASCNLSLEFAPQSTGSLAESFVLTDNDLNLTAATQSISLSGTAIPADSTSAAVVAVPSAPGVGQAVTITVTVSDTTNSGTVPTSAVTFSDSVDGNLNGGTGVTLVSGVATLSRVILSGSAGTAHTITANYQGVPNVFLASSNSITIHIAALTATAITLSIAPGSSVVVGTAVTLTATVAPAPTGTPLGTVSFYDGETSLGSGTLNSSGIATLATSSLPAGVLSLTAVYSGNAGFATSTSTAVTETVASAIATSTALTASPNPLADGQPVTLTASVSPAPTGTPLGTVSFYGGTTLLGTGTLDASGVATFTTSSLAAGDDSLTAVYAGNTAFAASTSSAVSETVTTAYTVTAPTAPVTVAPGGAATFNLTVPPLGGPFNNPVTLSASGLPPGASATFNPATVTPGSAGAPTVMTVQLPPMIAGALPPDTPPLQRRLPALPSFGLVFAMCAILYGFRRPKAARLIFATIALAGAALMFTGCGGGLGSESSTPAGSYVITVTGSSGTLQASTKVTLVVQ